MWKLKFSTCSVLMVGTLSACVGSGDSGFSQDLKNLESVSPTPASEMPTGGTATYSGHAGLDVMDNDIGDLDGDLALTADFARGSVRGTISGLKGDTGSFDGELAIQNAEIDSNTFTGNLRGEISRYAPEKEYPVGAVFGDENRIYGEFRGDSAGAVVGTFGGQATHFEGSGAAHQRFEAPVGIKGGFAATE